MNEQVTDVAALIAAALTERVNGLPVTDVYTPQGLGMFIAQRLADAGHLTDGIDWESDAEQLHTALQASPGGRPGGATARWWQDTGVPASAHHQTLRRRAAR